MEKKVVNLSGIFWANDYLQGKPLPKREPKYDKGFQKILDKETEKLNESKRNRTVR
jgi:hypothetical protein